MEEYSFRNDNLLFNSSGTTNQLVALEKKFDYLQQQLMMYINRQDIALCAISKLKDDILSFMFEDQIIKMYLPFATCDLVQTYILQNSTFWECSQLCHCRKYIPNGAVILDIGANIGNHTIFYSKFCDAEKIYAFEPQKTVYSILQRNIGLNDCKNVKLHNTALSDRICRGNINSFSPGNIGATAFSFSDTEGAFSATSLDTLNLEKVDFMKIDVEGAQLAMLHGAEKTIRKCRPVIVIELRYSQSTDLQLHEKEYKKPLDLLYSMDYILKEQIGVDDFIFVPSH